MEFFANIDIKKLVCPIEYGQKIMLIGSCFTEHIGNALAEHKFSVLQNPHGILFDPNSVSNSLMSYVNNKQYKKEELFYLNEVWNSWAHHSRFSSMSADEALAQINQSQNEAHAFLKKADWLIITLGSSFVYKLTEVAGVAKEVPPMQQGAVANCHRAPSQWFDKTMLAIEEIQSQLIATEKALLAFNPRLKFIYTISPVRHLRDGVVENNRSKARLIEAVHHCVKQSPTSFYFPAYELVIDVLRDYRFYDIDLAHPNYAATEFVMKHFKENYISEASQQLMEEVRRVVLAKKHKAFQPATKSHQSFLKNTIEKAKALQQKHYFLDFTEELDFLQKQLTD